MAALATVAQLAAWLNTTIESDDARAQLVLDAASGLVRAAAGQTWDGEDDEVPSVALTITLTAAARAWVNPTGADDSRSGPFGASWQPGQGGVLLTAEEQDTLGALSTSGSLYTISTTRGDLDTPAVTDPYFIGDASNPSDVEALW